MKDGMLTTSQVAERLGVGRSTVNLWCRQGKFPNAEARQEVIGNVWYVPESDLADFTPPKMGRPAKLKGDAPGAGVIEAQTKTTRRLSQSVKQGAELKMGGGRKDGEK
ncbi:MAG TPA: helix-turn-helix domain-containing protein [Pyrinomonadaceae bacterium]|jgi:excisionase family DNA binding protein